jgi:hypothetical protein
VLYFIYTKGRIIGDQIKYFYSDNYNKKTNIYFFGYTRLSQTSEPDRHPSQSDVGVQEHLAITEDGFSFICTPYSN